MIAPSRSCDDTFDVVWRYATGPWGPNTRAGCKVHSDRRLRYLLGQLISRIPEVLAVDKDTRRTLDWAGFQVVATVAQLLSRELVLQNEYLRTENKMPKSKIRGRIRFTDDERRSLAKAAVATGRRLMHDIVNVVKPETILAWKGGSGTIPTDRNVAQDVRAPQAISR